MNKKEEKGQNSLPEEKKFSSSNDEDLGAGIYAPLRKEPARNNEYSFSKGDDVLG